MQHRVGVEIRLLHAPVLRLCPVRAAERPKLIAPRTWATTISGFTTVPEELHGRRHVVGFFGILPFIETSAINAPVLPFQTMIAAP